MSIVQMLKCDGPNCRYVVCTKPPMKPTPSNLRLQGGQQGWTKQCRKDFCPSCSRKVAKPKRRRSRQSQEATS